MKELLQLLRNWTLPLAMLWGTGVYLLFANVPMLEPVAHVCRPFFSGIIPYFLFVILFVTFCRVDFHKMRPVGWHLWVGVIQVSLVLLAVAAILVIRPQGDSRLLMENVLTCVIAPCAVAAPVITSKLGGQLEEMTTYTFMSNFLTAALVPVCFPLIGSSLDVGFVEAFLLILYKVCLVLVLPMLLAYVVKHYAKALHQRIISIKDLSYYLWGVSLSIVTGVTVMHICESHQGVWILLAVAFLSLMLCLLQFVLGWMVGNHFGAHVNAGQALGQKNTGFAIWTAFTYLSPLSSVGPGCYILWQNIVNSYELWAKRRRDERSEP